MTEKELENRVENYLKKNNIVYIENTIKYGGKRENRQDKNKSFHIVFFHTEIIKNDPLSYSIDSILFDDESNRMEYFLNSQILKKIQE